jgi:hypothetical protein
VANAPCSSPQLACPGDPTTCDGNVFYDSMQCTWDGSAWSWSVLAETICGDSGLPDVVEDAIVTYPDVGTIVPDE